MSNIEKQIQKYINNNTLTVDDEILYLTKDTDILVIHVDMSPVIISMIEHTEDNGYIGVDPDDNEYILEDYNLLLFKIQHD